MQLEGIQKSIMLTDWPHVLIKLKFKLITNLLFIYVLSVPEHSDQAYTSG